LAPELPNSPGGGADGMAEDAEETHGQSRPSDQHRSKFDNNLKTVMR
jgi:hypothetical protein